MQITIAACLLALGVQAACPGGSLEECSDLCAGDPDVFMLCLGTCNRACSGGTAQVNPARRRLQETETENTDETFKNTAQAQCLTTKVLDLGGSMEGILANVEELFDTKANKDYVDEFVQALFRRVEKLEGTVEVHDAQLAGISPYTLVANFQGDSVILSAGNNSWTTGEGDGILEEWKTAAGNIIYLCLAPPGTESIDDPSAYSESGYGCAPFTHNLGLSMLDIYNGAEGISTTENYNFAKLDDALGVGLGWGDVPNTVCGMNFHGRYSGISSRGLLGCMGDGSSHPDDNRGHHDDYAFGLGVSSCGDGSGCVGVNAGHESFHVHGQGGWISANYQVLLYVDTA